MNPIVLKVAPYALAVLVLGGSFAAWTAHEREVGRLQVQLASADSMAVSAVAEAKNWERKAVIDSGRAAALEADTAKANITLRTAQAKYYATLGTLASSRRALDSAMQVAQQHPDSGTQGILGTLHGYLAHADSTAKACSDALTSADSALVSCQRQGAAVAKQLFDVRNENVGLAKDTVQLKVQLKDTRQAIPSALSVWGWRLLGFGIGLVAGKVGK